MTSVLAGDGVKVIASDLDGTLFGPDHYLPFIVMRKARGW